MSGRAAAAAEYPKKLCDRFLNGACIEEAWKSDKVQCGNVCAVTGSFDKTMMLCDMCDPEDGVDKTLAYVDSRTGKTIPETLVKQARKQELTTLKDMGVSEYATVEEFESEEDAKIIGSTWVDTDRGTPESPDVRSRLCGQEFAKGDPRDDIFAATPPLLGAKFLASRCATRTQAGWTRRLMVLDVRRAFLYGRTRRRIYMRLPKEDERYGTPGLLWRLVKAIYGTRDAPAIWQQEVRKVMESLGFTGSKSNPGIYWHSGRDIFVDVHVDDFLCCADRHQLEWLYMSLAQKFSLKKEMLGPEADAKTCVKFLGRELRWSDAGIEYEADDKHVKELLTEWCMENCRGVVSPGLKEDSREESEELSNEEATNFRRAVARLNYVTQDRPDISFATKELARVMSCPKADDVIRLKRTLRYLRRFPSGHFVYSWQEQPTVAIAYVDSDWAGCTRTRKSTSGGALVWGTHCLAHWARTQLNVALSSGEAELNAALKGGTELIGVRVLLQELGVPCVLELRGDSSACKGVLLREGSGKLKHIEVKQLWLQDHVQSGSVRMRQVPREQNVADAFTKHWGPDAHKHFCAIQFCPVQSCL